MKISKMSEIPERLENEYHRYISLPTNPLNIKQKACYRLELKGMTIFLTGDELITLNQMLNEYITMVVGCGEMG